ncbi:trans-2-enoyl-mitochondrial [Micractinium conductrix]|uniref:Trans-2-enoyl-mitochondrial n=1 Tax=Micractinium conductrix TaxID=554055 RepID=A0A2P6VHF6_9CHLO|nr:trans-2-enoyl-mitochondrial [Micractinium conductrix]|eukprot:PSC73519.1 trans-2-enoyl-mitochondrial [Micractinium conductrix]
MLREGDGGTALDLAVRCGTAEAVRQLLVLGAADVTTICGMLPPGEFMHARVLHIARGSVWSPATHHLWPPAFKAAARALLLALARDVGDAGSEGGDDGSAAGANLACLPAPLLLRVLQLAAAPMSTWVGADGEGWPATIAMSTNRAVQLHEHSIKSPSSACSIGDAPVPTPAQGEVLVRIHLRPVNPADVFSIQGVYPGFTPGGKFPCTPGLEGVCTVVSNGPGASKFAAGQRVVGAPFSTIQGGSGTWQQYMAVAEATLVAVPDAVSDDAAAQFWINPVTVYGMFEVLAVPRGEWLLQTAAGSVLGRQMVQLCRARGIKTINVVRRLELAAELKELGADEVVVNGSGERLVDRVKELTGGRGAYAAVECIGGDMFAQVASAVRASGTAIIYGAMSGLSASFSIPDPLFRDGEALRLPVEERERVCQAVLGLLADGTITPYSGQHFPLDQAAEAVKLAGAAARGGKVLLED